MALPVAFGPLALVAALAFGVVADAEGTSITAVESASSVRAKIAAILAREEPAGTRAAELAALGAEAVPELFDALCERFAGTSGDGDGAVTAPLLGALERIGRSAVLPVLEDHAAGEVPARRAVLAVIGVLGRRAELALAARAAAPGGTGPQAAPPLIEAFERTIQAVLEADPAAYGDLSWFLGSIPLEVAGGVVRAAAEAGDARALESLVRALGAVPELDATILAHLGRAARKTLPPGPEELTSIVRRYLTSPELDVARAALQAVGQLEDPAAVEACIGLLSSPSATLVETAHWSLVRITKLELPPGATRWEAWYRAERVWLEQRAPEQIQLLRTEDPAVLRGALDQIAQHRLDRHRLAGEVAFLLHAPDAPVRRLACDVIEQLGSRSVTPDLVELLSDPDDELADRAWRILRAWTGRDLPRDSPEWSKSFDGA